MTDPVFGPDAQGVVIYEKSGWMSMQIAVANRPVIRRPATRKSGVMTAEASGLAAGAFDTYYAFFGTWNFNADTSVVTHHVASSLLPYEAGVDDRREVTFDGAQLKLIARLQEGGEERTLTLVWRRVFAPELSGEPPATRPASSTPLTEAPQPPDPGPEAGQLKAPRVSATKYGDKPVDYKEAIRGYFLEHLRYPDTIQYREITAPEMGYFAAITGVVLMHETRDYGWTVKATINAKDSSNREVGFKSYTFLFRGETIVDTRLPLPGGEMNETAGHGDE